MEQREQLALIYKELKPWSAALAAQLLFTQELCRNANIKDFMALELDDIIKMCREGEG